MRIVFLVALGACTLWASPAHGQARARAAREAAEMLFERFGAKAGRSVPELTARIEGLAARYGDDAILAVRKGGPSALSLVEAAGADGAKAIRVLSVYGEQGASRVLSRPTAMKQFLQHGDEAAGVLVRHPGVAEPLLEKGGAQAVKALSSLEAQSGRRLAMLMEGELANAAHHPALLDVVGKYGERSVRFIWDNKATLAGGAALTAFLADPEPFLNGARNLTEVAGDAVIKPVVGGVTTVLTYALGTIGVLIVAAVVAVRKYGLPDAQVLKAVFALFGK